MLADFARLRRRPRRRRVGADQGRRGDRRARALRARASVHRRPPTGRTSATTSSSRTSRRSRRTCPSQLVRERDGLAGDRAAVSSRRARSSSPRPGVDRLRELATGGATVYLSYFAGSTHEPARAVAHLARRDLRCPARASATGSSTRFSTTTVVLEFVRDFGELEAGDAADVPRRRASRARARSSRSSRSAPRSSPSTATAARRCSSTSSGAASTVLCTYPLEHMAARTPRVNPERHLAPLLGARHDGRASRGRSGSTTRACSSAASGEAEGRPSIFVNCSSDTVAVEPLVADDSDSAGYPTEPFTLDPFGVAVAAGEAVPPVRVSRRAPSSTSSAMHSRRSPHAKGVMRSGPDDGRSGPWTTTFGRVRTSELIGRRQRRTNEEEGRRHENVRSKRTTMTAGVLAVDHRRRRVPRRRHGEREAVGAAAQRDALHVGHRVGAVQPVQPAPQQRQRDRHARAALRDAVPVRPAQGHVHPVARDRRQVGRQDLRRCTLRQGVKWSDGKPLTGADVKFTFETGKLAGSELSTMWKTGLSNIIVKGNTVSFVFTGKPNYLDWNTNIYSCGIVPAAPLEELQRDRDHDRQHRQVHGRDRPVHLRRRQGNVRHAAVEPAQQLVGDEGARDEDADAVPRRHPQHPEHRVAAELPQERHRPEQQLLPRRRQGDRREGADVLHEGAVHAVGEHRLARAEHDARAAERRGVPAGARDVDQRRPDRDGRLRQHRREGQPDRPASDLEQVDRPGAGEEAGLQVRHRRGEGAARRQRLQGHER